MYHLHDDGLINLGSPELTPLQRTVYMMSKAHWQEKEREEAKKKHSNSHAPAGTTGNESASWSR